MKLMVFSLGLVCCTVTAAHQPSIYIYADKGVSSESLAQTLHTTQALLNRNYTIQTLKADAVIKGKWRDDAALFIMPGGADIPYDKALRGKGNEQIKAFVMHGGAYLGICAGGYYGSQHIVFAPGTALEVKGDRELAFFKGTASGPALAPYDLNTNKGARAARLNLSNKKQATVYYNGGGQYVAHSMPDNFSIIARYRNLPEQPPAIIKVKVGEGVAILSGVHFDYDQALLNRTDPYLQSIIKTLKNHEQERQALLRSVFSQLGLEIM